jgi:tetratricopeptide (TPR) repeat protein
MNLSANLKNVVQLALVAIVFAGLTGCHLTSLPDPNDPKNIPPEKLAMKLHKDIQDASDELNQRVLYRDISDDQRKDLLAKRAGELLAEGDPEHCAPQDAWIYGDLMITNRDYQDAIPILKKAIQHAISIKDDDRRVNDSFRLARCLAADGQIVSALDLAQSIIDSKPADPGPVLPSILLELTPRTEGKGHDAQLAKLLEEAIHEHLRMKVDPTSEPGKMFLAAKPFHIQHAWSKIIELLKNSGHPDQAQAAKLREDAMMKSLVMQPVNA